MEEYSKPAADVHRVAILGLHIATRLDRYVPLALTVALSDCLIERAGYIPPTPFWSPNALLPMATGRPPTRQESEASRMAPAD